MKVALTAHEIALEVEVEEETPDTAAAQDDLPVTEAACEGCTACVYKEVVALLRKRVPEVDELVRLKEYEASTRAGIERKAQEILSKLGKQGN